MSFDTANMIRRFSLSATTLGFGLVGLAIHSGHLLAQTAPTQNRPSEVREAAHDEVLGADILTDTQGVNFGAYINQVIQTLSNASHPQKTLTVFDDRPTAQLSFIIAADGKVTSLHLDQSSNYPVLDRAAWGAISRLTSLSPLPKEFTGGSIKIRVEYCDKPN
jgi:TonB family protein